MASFAERIKIIEILFKALDSYSCEIGECNFVSQTAKKLLSHFNVVHRKGKNFSSPCLHSSHCPHKDPFTSFDGLNKHLRTYHESFFHDSIENEETLSQQVESDEDNNNDEPSTETNTHAGILWLQLFYSFFISDNFVF